MMTGANIGADSYGKNRDEDYQAESPAPSNQVCHHVVDADSIEPETQLPCNCCSAVLMLAVKRVRGKRNTALELSYLNIFTAWK